MYPKKVHMCELMPLIRFALKQRVVHSHSNIRSILCNTLVPDINMRRFSRIPSCKLKKKKTSLIFEEKDYFLLQWESLMHSKFMSTSGSDSFEFTSGNKPPTPELEDQSDPDPKKKKSKFLKVIPRKRKATPSDYKYSGNIYILPSRAVSEYLLKLGHLDELPKYSRRSPYDGGSRIILYLRSDVEELALKVWGSYEELDAARAKQKQTEENRLPYDILHGKSLSEGAYDNPDHPEARRLAEGKPAGKDDSTSQDFWKSGSTKVVLSAILINSANSLIKLLAWIYTGSHSMFSEFIHSCADTMNQIVLGIGLYHSHKKPDTDHPYGYKTLRNVSSLISGVGIFFCGTGLSYYHCIHGLMHPQDLGSLTWCVVTLMGSFISEGATLIIAFNQVRKNCAALNISFKKYLTRGVDPNVSVVLLEDLAAVLGVSIAGACIFISHYTNSSTADAIGSGIIGSILGFVATFIIYNNTLQLVGRSIPEDERKDIRQILEMDVMIRSLHDIKATHMGGDVRFKAEVDFDGQQITQAYLNKQDMELLLKQMQELQTVEDVEMFMLVHGEKIIDTLGEEVDRIENVLKLRHPEIRHIDLEAL